MHTVGNDGRSAGTTARANGNVVFLGVADKIPHDEIVVHIAHPGNDTDLILKALLIAFRRIIVAFGKAVIAKLAEVFLVGVAVGHRECGQMIFVEHEFHIAAIGDALGILKRLVAIGEQLPQFFLALEVEFLSLEFHAVCVVHRLAHLDAHQHILHGSILFTQIVGVVGHHQRKSCFPGKSGQSLIDGDLFGNAVILQFQVEIALPKNPRQLQRVVFGGFIVLLQVVRHCTGQAGRQGDETLVVLFKQGKIHSGLAVEAVGKCLGHQQAQVFVALAVFTQQHKMEGLVVQLGNAVCHGPAGHINLAADDGLDAGSLGSLVKINAAVHDAVVGDGDSGLPQLLHPVHHAADAAGAVKEAIFRMYVQMDKAHCAASFESSTSFLSR